MSEEAAFAERLLELAAGAASGADVEITVERTCLSLTRFANSRIHQNVADDVLRARVRLHREGRTATLTSTRLDDEGARDLAARAFASVAVAPLDPGWPGVAPPSEAGDVAAVDRTSWDATPDDRAQRVGAFIDAAAGLEVAGYCRTTSIAGAFVNSAGHRVTTKSAEVAMDGVAR
ncbi:MAG: TldD/PmbA family protein, partial [Actinomycetota bacterium]|nr:TldD/PmbA family protein [Actinomycetota bacterium]